MTTRDRRLLARFGAAAIELDVLGVDAAQELLGRLTEMAPAALPPETEGILGATGRVALVGAAIGRGGQPWAEVAARLAAVELDRYQALACFPEDTVVPPATIGRLWEVAEPELGGQLRRFAALRLLRLEAGGVAFHDL